MEAGRTSPGWWLASDGRWYPPELHSDYKAQASADGIGSAGRRRVPRQGAGWPGSYRLEDDPESEWGECQILDVSVFGAGIEIFGPVQDDLVGHKITVDARTSDGGSASLRFVGVVRNVRPGPSGQIRTGIEFSGLSEDRLRVAW